MALATRAGRAAAHRRDLQPLPRRLGARAAQPLGRQRRSRPARSCSRRSASRSTPRRAPTATSIRRSAARWARSAGTRDFTVVVARRGQAPRACASCPPPAGSASGSTARAARCASPRASRSTSARPPRRSRPIAARARVHAATGCGALVNLGGDIALAGPAPSGGWPIRVTDDHRSDATAEGQTIALAGGGLATSSTTVRRWRAGDGRSCTTSSIRAAARRRARSGARSASPPAPASRPTRPARPRSCAARRAVGVARAGGPPGAARAAGRHDDVHLRLARGGGGVNQLLTSGPGLVPHARRAASSRCCS